MTEISFDEEDGDTPTVGINHKHRNIIDLNYVNLGTVIQSMIYGFQNDRYIHMTRGKLRQLLADAYEQNKLNTEELAPSVLRDIEKLLRQDEGFLKYRSAKYTRSRNQTPLPGYFLQSRLILFVTPR